MSRSLLLTLALLASSAAGPACKRTSPRVLAPEPAPPAKVAAAPVMAAPAPGEATAAASDGSATSRLPPGHPSLDGAPGPGGGLPPGHPAPGSELPPDHPTTGAAGAAEAAPSLADQHRAAATGPAGVTVKPVARASGPGAHTVQEVWAKRSALSGQAVTVHAQVVKSTEVMNRHFLHLRDGSGTRGEDDDLTVTTPAAAAVGDVVTVTGKVALDVDFGAGYRYPVILQDAAVAR